MGVKVKLRPRYKTRLEFANFKPLTAKLYVSRSRDSHLQVTENYSDWTKWTKVDYFQILLIDLMLSGYNSNTVKI